MHLSEFIEDSADQIVEDFAAFVSTLPEGRKLAPKLRKNRMKDVVLNMASDIATAQDEEEQAAKSKGQKAQHEVDTIANIHGESRLEDGLSILDINAEYRALRANILKLWVKQLEEPTPDDFKDMIRFNEAVDEALQQSILRYHSMVEEGRTIFLGVLGHDLRNPLGAIQGIANIIEQSDAAPDIKKLSDEIKKSSIFALDITNNLLELARSKIGAGQPLKTEEVNLTSTLKDAVEETRHVYPKADIQLTGEAEIIGEWDGMRLQQLFTNLLRNAAEHGDQTRPITVTVQKKKDTVGMQIHNYGPAIPPEKIGKIFEKHTPSDSSKPSRNLGLGLYIACEIMRAHNGKIKVFSTDEEGTTFNMTLPIHPDMVET